MASSSLTESLQETLTLFDNTGEPWTTSEVADHLDLGRRSTYERLERLVEHGCLETKKVGASARVWWRPQDGVGRSVSDWEEAAESLVDDVLQDAEVGVFVLDEDFDVTWINRATEQYFGLERDEVLGCDKRVLVDKTIADVVADSATFAETVLATYDDNTYTERFQCHVTPGETREERWLEHRSKPIESGAFAGGRVELYYDVTDHKNSERARQSEREQFESLVDAVEEYAIFLLDEEGRIQTWNPGAEQIKGYTTDETVGEHFSTFYTEEDVEAGAPEANLKAAVANGETKDEGWRVREDGSHFWANVTITAIRDDDGDLEGFAKVTRDMTERRAKERRLEQQRDELESELDDVFDRISAGFYGLDDDLRFTHINDRAESLLGLQESSVVGRDVRAALTLTEPFQSALEEALESQMPVSLEDYYEPLDAWFENDIYPSETGVSVYFREVTERKERERELERYAGIIDAVGEPAYELDAQGRFIFVNEPFVEQSGYTEDELLGEHVSIGMDEETIARVESQITEFLADGAEGSITPEYEVLTKGGDRIPVENPISILTDENGQISGSAGILRDITKRKQREQGLQLYETIVSEAHDGIYVVDDEFCFTKVNEAYVEMTGYDREELLGTHCSLVVDDDVVQSSAELLQDMFAGEKPSATLEADIQRADGGTLRAESKFTDLVDEETGERKKVGVVRDISERAERERELEESRQRYRTLVDNFPMGAVALVDDDLRYVTVGGTPLEEANKSIEDLEGRRLENVLPPELSDLLIPRYRAALNGEPSSFEQNFGDRYMQFQVVPVRDDDGDVFAAMGMSQDITEQKEREQELREAKAQLEAATEAGKVGTWEWHIPEDRFVAGPSLAKTFGTDPDVTREGVPLDRIMSAIHEDDRDRVEREIEAAVASCGEYEEQYRVWNDDEIRWVVARGHVECGEDGNPVSFPGALIDITAQKRAEQESERQREQLAALNSLNEVVHDITNAVIDQSTREEIEDVVVEGLADADSFSFAWIGDVDRSTQTVDLRTEAGVDDYLDNITISVDSEDERSQGPGGQAYLTREVQVAQDIEAEETFGPWREHAMSYDVRSSAGVPIAYGDRIYGVLGVYAERPLAFEEAEQEILSQLGEAVGHAIAAIERKRALMSDEVVELEYLITDIYETLGIDATTDGKITLDQAVPTTDEEYLVYGTATEEARPALEAIVNAVPHWENVTELGKRDGIHRFEVQLSEPPVLSVVASQGGYVQEAVIEDGDYHMTIHLPPSIDTRSVADAVTDAYPTAELLAQRQFSRTAQSTTQFERLMHDDLTERQRATLEAAYHAGFFEWPRDAAGEDVADSLGVSPPTFHQHLRKAEKKVFDNLLSAPATS